ncbi:MAG TPA: hypothetical protein VMH86_06605 [Rhizomicrobium sp.]|nr:hypothetical protein [Rhizomicrobium sp.]
MGVLIAFIPFIVFSLLAGVSMSLSLWAALAAAFVVGIRDFLHSKSLRVLDAGGMALFFVMALFVGFVEPTLKDSTTRLVIDLGFLLMSAVSLVRKSPASLGYAREFVPPEIWNRPDFLRANYVVTGVWTAAFATATAFDGIANFDHDFSATIEIAGALTALVVAIAFTARYRPLAPMPVRRPAALRW